MTIARIIPGIILASAAAAATLVMSAALAQQTTAGTVTKIDRVSGTIAIRQAQDGTIGANTGGAAEEFKVKDAPLLDAVHAGDRVSFSVTENGGVKTITKLQKQ
jgi:Cu/Ag efflux protein CusF